RFTQIVLKRPGDTPVSLTCLVPNNVTPDQLSTIVKATNGKRLRQVFSALKRGRVLPDTGLSSLSPEAQAFSASVQAPKPKALLNQACQWVKGEFVLWVNDNGEWILVEFEIYSCDEGGGDLSPSGALWYWLI